MKDISTKDIEAVIQLSVSSIRRVLGESNDIFSTVYMRGSAIQLKIFADCFGIKNEELDDLLQHIEADYQVKSMAISSASSNSCKKS